MLYAKRFTQLGALIVVVGMALHIMLSNLISVQQEQNSYLMEQFTQRKMELVALQKKQQIFAHLEAQMHFIAALQKNNIRIANSMKQIVKYIPLTISLSEIKQKNNVLTVNGIAASDFDIINFMEIIAKNGFFQQPVLITSHPEITGKYFQLQVQAI